MKQLVIYGAITDPHLVRVSNKLLDKGVSVFFLDPIELTNCNYLIGPNSSENIHISAINYSNKKVEKIDITNIVFWRRNKRRISVLYNEQDQYDYYTLAEIDNFLDGLVFSEKIKEVSSTINRYRHEHKLFQLTLAKKVGLTIPSTLISNEKSKVLSFLNINSDSIVKPLKHPTWMPPLSSPEKQVTILVNSISSEEILNTEEKRLSIYPLIFQENISKSYELRIVAFNQQVVAYKIDSQLLEIAKTDWRRGTRKLNYEKVEIPSALCTLICKYLSEAQISYGIFDFIYSKNGGYVFLECNSDGQWAFLEENIDKCAISTMFAEEIEALCL